MKIAFDLDEVLAEFVQGFLKYYNRVYAKNLTYNDIFSYNFADVLGGTREENMVIVKAFQSSPEFLAIEPVAGAIDTVRMLAAANELIIITSRDEMVKRETLEWVERFFPGCFGQIYFTSDYYVEQAGQLKKADICRIQKVDIMVDDSYTFAEECSVYCRKAFLVSRPWNVTAVCSNNVVRINSVAEVLSLVASL